MSWIIDAFAAFGLVALVALIYAVSVTAAKIRRANNAVRTSHMRGAMRASLVKEGAKRSAGEAATPSPYTIPKGPST